MDPIHPSPRSSLLALHVVLQKGVAAPIRVAVGRQNKNTELSVGENWTADVEHVVYGELDAGPQYPTEGSEVVVHDVIGHEGIVWGQGGIR